MKFHWLFEMRGVTCGNEELVRYRLRFLLNIYRARKSQNASSVKSIEDLKFEIMAS